MKNKILFSCVLDYSPVMAVQSYIWLTNLLYIEIDPQQIYIHLVSEVPDEFLKYLQNTKVNIVRRDPFDERNKYCNKLVQLQTFRELEDYDYVFLMDCDTAIVSLEDLKLEDNIYAKVVDFPNPPLNILNKVFNKNQLSLTPVETTFSMEGEKITDWNNCNGGLYIISKMFLKNLMPKWEFYSTKCIEQSNIFTESYSKHADQVGLALALASLNEKVTHLGIEWNYPIHVANTFKVSPKIIHFHNHVNEQLQLKSHESIEALREIEIINSRVNKSLENNLNNSLFWDYRYATCPELGSGVGSRGETLLLKKKLISLLTYERQSNSIIDVGFGDLELMKDMPFSNYTGLDLSEKALKIAKRKRPEWTFLNKSIDSHEIGSYDITMCFDVLIHQSDPAIFTLMVKSLVEKANYRVIIGAYNENPSYDSTITHFHNSIFDEVAKYDKFNELAIVKKYRDVSVLVGTVINNEHQRDISSDSLNRAFKEVRRPDLLQYLVDVSRYHLGFYTAHYPRVFEYTWLLEQMENRNNLRVLDIGAGVCPIPICLNHFGLKITTVDSHPIVRRFENKSNWNEWGFLDYSEISNNIESKHKDFTEVRSLLKYDCIYSISVIEHMPLSIRLKMLKRASRLLKKGGELLLTIDIAPQTNEIWNYSEGKQVESKEIHGTMESFREELKKYGFKIVDDFIQRDIYESRTDVWYIKSVLKHKSWL